MAWRRFFGCVRSDQCVELRARPSNSEMKHRRNRFTNAQQQHNSTEKRARDGFDIWERWCAAATVADSIEWFFANVFPRLRSIWIRSFAAALTQYHVHYLCTESATVEQTQNIYKYIRLRVGHRYEHSAAQHDGRVTWCEEGEKFELYIYYRYLNELKTMIFTYESELRTMHSVASPLDCGALVPVGVHIIF